MFFDEESRCRVTQFSESERSHYSSMNDLLKEQVKKIIKTNHQEVQNNFLETIDNLGMSLRRDTIMLFKVIEYGQHIIHHHVTGSLACDEFVKQFFQKLQNFLPKKRVKETIFEDQCLFEAIKCVQLILNDASLRLKIQQTFALHVKQIVQHLFFLSSDTFKSSASCMLFMSGMDSKYLLYISGYLLNPLDASDFYQALLSQKRLDIQYLPKSVQLSEELRTIVLQYYHQQIKQAIIYGALGLGFSILGILLLTQASAFLTMMGSFSLVTSVGIVSIFVHEYLTSPWHTQRQVFAI